MPETPAQEQPTPPGFADSPWPDLVRACLKDSANPMLARAELVERLDRTRAADPHAYDIRKPSESALEELLVEAAALPAPDIEGFLSRKLIRRLPSEREWPVSKTPPPTEFLVRHWIPLGEVGSLTGTGGNGKTKLALMLAAGIATGGQAVTEIGEGGQDFERKVWLPVQNGEKDRMGEIDTTGTVVLASWEDRYNEILRRLHWMSKQPGLSHVTAQALLDRLVFLDMRDAGPLWGPIKHGAHTSTGGELKPAGEAVQRIAEDAHAKLVIVDPLAAAYACSENDRALVRAFLSKQSAWATKANCTVLLISHPPKAAGTTYSGSTDWQGGSRFMLALERSEETGFVADASGNPVERSDETKKAKALPAMRLTLEKSNYSRPGRSVWMRWLGKGAAWEQCGAKSAVMDERERRADPFYAGPYGEGGNDADTGPAPMSEEDAQTVLGPLPTAKDSHADF